MQIIAHRCNLDGPNSIQENTFVGIREAYNIGFQSEIDLWYANGFYLGHDGPEHAISIPELRFVMRDVWIHCKNPEAVKALRIIEDDKHKARYFMHDSDSHTVVSNGFVWVYPGSNLVGKMCVAVLPETVEAYTVDDLARCSAICTDYPQSYSKIIKEYKYAYSNHSIRTLQDLEKYYQEFLEYLWAPES